MSTTRNRNLFWYDVGANAAKADREFDPNRIPSLQNSLARLGYIGTMYAMDAISADGVAVLLRDYGIEQD